jgi:putative FmdB family regulatory protein
MGGRDWHSYTSSAMPIYEYRCERGHTFEVLQRMADDPVSVCTDCDSKVERVMHPVAVHFKGSGFYTTDYGKKGRSSGESGESKNGSDSGDKGSNKDGGSSAGSASKGGESSKTGASSSSSSSSSSGKD